MSMEPQEEKGTEKTESTTPAGRGALIDADFDRLWDAFLTPWRRIPSFAGGRVSPPIDVFEKEGALHVRAELPGMTDKDVEVSTSDGVLTISGQKKEEHEVKEENYYRSERSYGKFRRQVALPSGADSGRASAHFKDGILDIEVPMRPQTEREKRIEVKNG